MTAVGIRSRAIYVIAVALFVLTTRTPAEAGLVWSFDLQESYNDNVIGLVQDNPNTGGMTGGGGLMSGMSVLAGGRNGLNGNPGGMGGGAGSAAVQQGDISTFLAADMGMKTDWGEKTDLLLLAAISHTAFATYGEFDFTVGTLSAGITRRFSDLLSARLSLKAAAKDFADDLRDSAAFGGSAWLKEAVNNDLWFKQTYEFERNRADSPLYSYRGHAATARIGYSPSSDTSLDLGYGYLLRQYDTPENFEVTTRSLSATFTLDLNDSWSCSLGYDRELADSNVPDTASTNNIYTVGLRYDY